MKNFIAFVIILCLLAIVGSVWGMYEFQAAQGMKTAQTLALIKSYFVSLKPKPPPKKPIIIEIPPEPKPVVVPKVNKPVEKPVPKKPLPAKPVKPVKVEPSLPPPIEKPPIKTREEELIEDGNKYYDEGVVHLEKTFDKNDENFDKENDLAMDKFKKALDKYHEAEKTSPDDVWLRDRIRETNDYLIGCRKQGRRK